MERNEIGRKATALAFAAAMAVAAPQAANALFDPCDVYLGGDWIGVQDSNDFQACYLPEDAKGPGPLTDDFVMAYGKEGDHLYDIYGGTTCNPDGFIGGSVSVFSTSGGSPTVIPVVGRFRSNLAVTRTEDKQGEPGEVIDLAKLSQQLAMKGQLREERQQARIRAKAAKKLARQNAVNKADADKIIPPPDFFEELLVERMKWDVAGCLFFTGGDPACFDIIVKYALTNCAFSAYYLDGGGEFTKPNFGQYTTMGYFDYPGGLFSGGVGTAKNTFYDLDRAKMGRNQTSLRIGSLWTRSTAISMLPQSTYESFLTMYHPCFYRSDVLGSYFVHGSLAFSTPSALTTYTDRTLSR